VEIPEPAELEEVPIGTPDLCALTDKVVKVGNKSVKNRFFI
jgi:hypothetical protein